jgi:hypothetical protein
MSTKRKGSRISNYQKEDYEDFRAAYESSYQGEYQQDRGNASQQSGYADGGSMYPGSRSGTPENGTRQRRSLRRDESIARPWERPYDETEE